MIAWNRNGATREVFLTRRHAIKVPKLTYGWRAFLVGLLSNLQERAHSGYSDVLCPILFSDPLGLVVVMPRAAGPISNDELARISFEAFGGFAVDWGDREDPDEPIAVKDRGGRILPVELKEDSFGWLDGRLVAVDYGGWR